MPGTGDNQRKNQNDDHDQSKSFKLPVWGGRPARQAAPRTLVG